MLYRSIWSESRLPAIMPCECLGGQSDIAHFYSLRGGDFHRSGSRYHPQDRLPRSDDRGQKQSVVRIVDIELYAVSGKCAGILHGVLHAVHNNFCTHGNERVRGINGYGVIRLGICAACGRSACPLAAAYAAAAIALVTTFPRDSPTRTDFVKVRVSFSQSLYIDTVPGTAGPIPV